MVFNSTPKRNIAELEQTIVDLVQRVEDLERDCADNTNFVEGMKALAENPENEGKYFGVKDEMVDLLDAPTELEQTVEQHTEQITQIMTDLRDTHDDLDDIELRVIAIENGG